MLRATSIVRRPAVHIETVVDSITLDHVARHRRRMAMTADGGLSFLLDLEKATVLEEGDAIRLADGRLVAVKAAPERLVEIRTESPLRLLKVAWHLGNRHVPAAIEPARILIRADPVIASMLLGLGAEIGAVEAPFDPEGGAYAQEEARGSHGHGLGARDEERHGHA